MREEIRKLFPLEFYVNDKGEIVAEMSITTLNKLIDEIEKLETLIKKYDCELTHKTKQYEFLRHNESKEIKRLYRRNKEVYKEVRDYAYTLCFTSEEKVIAKRIIEHLATYLLFNTPIRKEDNK